MKRFRYFIAAAVFLLVGLPPAHACYDLAGCQALVNTNSAPQCCCAQWNNFTPAFASQNACLCQNGFNSYCGASPPGPSTCNAAGYQNASTGFCPGSIRCTGFQLGGKDCICAPAEYWAGDYCALGAPAVGDCTTIPGNAGQWKKHACDAGPGYLCADSDLPVPPPPGGGTFASLANKMAVCCGRGWGENIGPGLKMDCVEAKPPPVGTFQSFLNFYSAGATSDFVTTAGLTYPNRMFVVDSAGIPLNGFYDRRGRRCNYRDPATKTAMQLTPADQLDLLQYAITNSTLASGVPTGFVALPPGSSAATSTAEVDPSCCNAVIFALERICPETVNPATIGGKILSTDFTAAGVTTRRCTAAKQMKLDFAVVDVCDPSLTQQARFRVATSFTGEDPNRATIFPTGTLEIQALINTYYPPTVPLAPPTCPQSPAIFRYPGTGGMCRLQGQGTLPAPPNEPYP